MDLRQLRCFQAVAEELSFSRAARKLRVAQPAISRTIRELEEQLGTRLLNRTRRSVALTPAGAVLLQEAALLLQRVEEARRRVLRTAAGEEGELRVGYIGPPTQRFLAGIVREYQRLHPRVTVILEERTPERVWEMVARGRLEIGLTRPVMSGPTSGLRTLLLRRERLCAVVPHGHRFAGRSTIPWRMLEGEPLIVLARREGVSLHDAMLEGCHRARFEPGIVHTPSLISTVLTYVEAGAGIGIVTDSISEIAGGYSLSFLPLTPARHVDLVMVWREADDTPPSAAFRRLLARWLAGEKSTGGKP